MSPTFRDFPMPALVEEQSRRWLGLAEHDRTVAVPKPSSTVLLVRESGSAPEVFVLRRASGMPFAPGMLAFPGGGVDPRDADPSVPWTGPEPEEWAERLLADAVQARELVIAAAREVFEECGVLLAGPTPDEVVADLTDPSWGVERQRLLDRTQSFGEMLGRLGLVLRTDLLTARAHWITPECEPRRYDTRFFAARMPEGQIADDTSSEAETARWATAEDILAAQAGGEEILLPPTQVMVEQLARAGDVDAWLRELVPLHPIQPWPVEHSGALWMRSPIDADGHGMLADTDAGFPGTASSHVEPADVRSAATEGGR